MFCLVHIQPAPNALYYFQAFEKLMAASKWLDDHLSYHVLKHLDEEKRWYHLRGYCHHPLCHVTLSPYLFWSPYGDDTLFTICGVDWAREVPRTKEWDHEIPSIFWLHEDYIIASEDQKLKIYHKWRERQCKLNNLTSHF